MTFKLRLIALFSVLFTVLAAVPAMAQDMPDEDYVTRFFGTSLIFTATKQLVDPSLQWWGDSLPESLRYDNGYLAGLINARRIQNGVKPLLDPQGYNISVGYENPLPNGSFEYNIDFVGIRPSEIEIVLESLGGATGVLAGTSTSFRPLRTRSFNASSYDPSTPLVLNLGVSSVTVEANQGLGSLRSNVERLLKEYYGPTVIFDIYFSQYSYRDGTMGTDINVYAEIPDPNAAPIDYSAPVG